MQGTRTELGPEAAVDPRRPVIPPSAAGCPAPAPRHFLDSQRLAEV
jgi:hypothetical protein